jgi:hypothetical protein
MLPTLVSLTLAAMSLGADSRFQQKPSTAPDRSPAAYCLVEQVGHRSDGKVVSIQAVVFNQCLGKYDFDGTAVLTLNQQGLGQVRLDDRDRAVFGVTVPIEKARGAQLCVSVSSAVSTPDPRVDPEYFGEDLCQKLPY